MARFFALTLVVIAGLVIVLSIAARRTPANREHAYTQLRSAVERSNLPALAREELLRDISTEQQQRGTYPMRR